MLLTPEVLSNNRHCCWAPFRSEFLDAVRLHCGLRLRPSSHTMVHDSCLARERRVCHQSRGSHQAKNEDFFFSHPNIQKAQQRILANRLVSLKQLGFRYGWTPWPDIPLSVPEPRVPEATNHRSIIGALTGARIEELLSTTSLSELRFPSFTRLC